MRSCSNAAESSIKGYTGHTKIGAPISKGPTGLDAAVFPTKDEIEENQYTETTGRGNPILQLKIFNLCMK